MRTQIGYHSIKVTDRKDPENIGLEAVKKQLAETLRREKKQEVVQTVLASLREGADVKINLPEVPAPLKAGP